MNTYDLSTCYRVLEIDESTPYAEIKLAYRDLVEGCVSGDLRSIA